MAQGSLLRKYLGDRRFLLMLPRAVTLQVLHPGIAAALDAHAPNQLWHHKKRAVTHMIGLAYSEADPRPVIRFAHEHITGTDETGRRYHALRPDLFFFQHATYVESLVTAINTFAKPLEPAAYEQLYRECCEWYERYGISSRMMPTTWDGFTAYFAEVCANELTVTAEGARLLPLALRPNAWIPSLVPDAGIRGIQHARARELLGMDQTPWQKTAFALYATTVRTCCAASPRLVRLIPGARRVPG
ncbi:oxygenase MpaB family protein [Mycobacterium sp. 48b]|uniref:oxygenase MpaB family protein n=1 Tax=Mycobacterium sp. 48b TaxID=3400426 RepID=UPI003AAE8730